MAGRDAQVRVEITADDKAGAILGNIGREIEGLASQSAGLGSLLSAFSVGLGPGIVAGISAGIFELAQATAEYEATLDHASKVSAMSVEKLSALRVTSSETRESFDSLTVSLGRLGKSIGEALTDPSSKAAKTLALLFDDAQIQALKLKSVDERIQVVVSAIFGLTDANARQLVMSDLLGRGWQSNIETLRALATEGYDPLIAKAKEVGEYIDASHAEAARQYEKAWAQLKGTLAGTGHTIGDSVIPALTALYEVAARTIQAMQNPKTALPGASGFAAMIAQQVAASDEIVDSDDRMAGAEELINKVLGANADAHARLALALRTDAGAHRDAATAAIEYKDPVAKLLQPLIDQYNALGMNADQLKIYTLAKAGADEAEQAYAGRLLTAIGAEKAWQDQNAQTREAAAAYLQNLRDFAEGVRQDVMTPVEQADQKLERLNEAFRTGALSPEVYYKAVDKLAKGLDAANLETLKESDSIQRVTSFGEELGASMEHSFSRMIVYGRGFTDILQGLIEKLVEMILQAYVFKEIADSLSGAGGIGGFFGSLFGGLAGRASGGDVSAGSAYLIGEQGPELFLPRVSGSVVPHSGMGAGGVTINNYMNVDARGSAGGTEHQVARAAAALQKSAAKLARAQMLEAQARG
jgi:hypothetical protein